MPVRHAGRGSAWRNRFTLSKSPTIGTGPFQAWALTARGELCAKAGVKARHNAASTSSCTARLRETAASFLPFAMSPFSASPAPKCSRFQRCRPNLSNTTVMTPGRCNAFSRCFEEFEPRMLLEVKLFARQRFHELPGDPHLAIR